jgi:deoxyribonuclease IV
MYYFGAHIPREKTLLKTLERLVSVGGNTLQIFAGNPYGGKVNRNDYETQGPAVKEYLKTNRARIIIHCAYTLNFAKSKSEEHPYWIDALWQDLQIADTLGADGCVLHVGKAVERDIKTAENNMIENLKIVIERCQNNNVSAKIFVETAAGQGTELYPTKDNSLDPLKEMYTHFSGTERNHIAFCVDTCHIFAAGYDISSPEKVVQFFAEWKDKIGIKNLGVIHINNSQNGLGASVDRHACLEYGKIPIKAIDEFIRTAYKLQIPIVLETPAALAEVTYLEKLALDMSSITLPPNEKDTVLIVDCGYLMFYRYHATKRSLVFKLKRDPTHQEILDTYAPHLEEQLKKTIKKTKAKLVLFCKDTSRAQLWRTKLWPEYKITRSECSDELKECFKKLDDIELERFGHVFQQEHLEADDLAALCLKYIEKVKANQEVVFLTNDRDYLQLLRRPSIRIIDAALKEIKGSGDHTIDVLAKILMGDKSDNIPAVAKNCGPKTALGIANGGKEKLEQFIRDKKCQEAFDRNEQLIRLDRIPTDLEESFAHQYKFV